MTQSRTAASESWLGTLDAVLRGLNHEFSNRLSLARLAPQLTSIMREDEAGLGALTDEAARSEDLFSLLRLYRLMVFENSEPADPLLVADVIADAAELFRHHTAFRDLAVEPGEPGPLPPVLMSPAALTQAVLLLLCAAARHAPDRRGDTGTIALTFAAGQDAVRITATAVGAETAPVGAEPPEFPALRYLVRDAEGVVEAVPGGATLTIGTLVRLRRREKRG